MRIFSLIFILALSACQQRGEEPTSPPLSESSPPGEVFTSSILQGEDPNDYQVSLEWNEEVVPVTWYLKRGEKEHELEQIAMLDGTQFEFVDSEVQPGKTYHYLLGFTLQGDFIIREKLSIEVPRDVVATRFINKLNFTNVNRVFFKGKSQYCHHPDLTIVANEVIAEDAVLRYVGYSRTDPVNTLTIVAKKAHGHLKIVADGVHGSTGFRKASYMPQERKPRDGAHSPGVHVEVGIDQRFSVDVERSPGKGGEWFQEPQTPGGKDGELRPFCIRLAGREFGDCSSYPILLKEEEVNHE